MILEGCQSKSKEISIEERICPQCGHEIEIFSVDTEAACEHCGFVIYYARQCVGDRMYEDMMEIARRNIEKRGKSA